MQYRIHRSGNYLTSQWSGGKTTQLAIYPEKSDYAEQDFIWRLSSATVETPESDFTKLPDYKRILLILKGEMMLSYENGNTVTLKEFEQESFDGALSTKSFGKAKDFNLMYKKGNEGRIEVLNMDDKPMTIPLGGSQKYDYQFHCFYCLGERAELSYHIERIALKKGDLLEIRAVSQKKIELKITGHGKLVNASVYFNMPNKSGLVDEAL